MTKLNDPGYRAHEAEYLLALCSIWTRVGQLIGPSRAFGAELSSTHLDLAQLTRLAAHCIGDGAPECPESP